MHPEDRRQLSFRENWRYTRSCERWHTEARKEGKLSFEDRVRERETERDSIRRLPNIQKPQFLAKEEPKDEPPSYHGCRPDAREKLRRFLLMCLASDYGAVRLLPQKLTPAEWLDMVQLSKDLRQIARVREEVALSPKALAPESPESDAEKAASDELAPLAGQECREDIVGPIARALGIFMSPQFEQPVTRSEYLIHYLGERVVKPAWALGISPGTYLGTSQRRIDVLMLQ